MKTGWIILALSLLLHGMPAVADLESGLLAYERGDYHTALRALIPLGEAGEPHAQYVLGRMFARGEGGVLQDYVEAYKWYNLAAARRQPLAAAAREALAQRMSTDQIAAAQALARDWRPLGRLPDQPTAPLPFEVQPLEPTPTPEPRDITSETLVTLIQLNLKRLGYTVTQIDGRLDSATQSAIRDFQADQDLTVNGQASAALLQRLEAVPDPGPPIRMVPPQKQPPEVENDWQRLM
jgi:TPR repeat protein